LYFVRPPYFLKKLYSKATWRKDKSKQTIYLTFDDGPVPEVTPWVLDLLKQKNVAATFFCVGENVRKYPSVYNSILRHNHSIGNHTYHHLNGWSYDTIDYIKNIESCDEVLISTSSPKLFRPPYGKLKTTQLKHIINNYDVIMWDVLSGDFDKDTTREQCLLNVTKNVRNGSIIVFHDSIKAQENLKYTLPRFIDFALEKGFEFKVL
jgi:peptidoglycan/xylan/chitin deacetylase (PgdA/CDA1 family)